MKKVFLIIIFYTIIFGFKAQDYEVYKVNYGVDQGLPSSECYQIIQDKKGYIWFGTDRGVVRYNGNEFKTFTTVDGLNNNVVFYLAEGPDGKIWFYDKTHQLSCFHNDSIYPYQYNDKLSSYVSGIASPLGITIDSSNTIYFSLSNRKSKNRIWSISATGEVKSSKNNPFNMDFYLTEGEVVINMGKSSSQKMKKLEEGLKLKIHLKNKINEITSTLEIAEDGFYPSVNRAVFVRNKLYFNYANKLYSLSELGKIELVTTFKKGIIELEKDEQGNIYVGLFDDGLWVLPPKGIIYQLISDCSVSGFLKDKEGKIWASTLDKGVYYMPSPYIAQYTKTKNTIVNHIAGNSNTIVYSNRKGELFSEHKGLKLGLDKPSYVRNITSIQEHFLISLGTSYSYLYKDLNERPILLSASSVDWLATTEALYGVPKGMLVKIEKKKLQDIDTLKVTKNNYNCLVNSYEEGKILLGTNNGIYQYEKDSISVWKNDEGIFKTRISDMGLFHDSILFISTRGEGLIIQKKGKKPYKIKKDKGLVCNELDHIYINGNYVFVSSKEGMSLLSFYNKGYDLSTYTSDNGLLSNEVNGVFERNDTVWVATNKGITKFNLLYVKENFKIPVYLNEFKVLGKKVDLDANITLQYFQNEIEISYEAISFENKRGVKYRYKLLGVDKTWKETNINSLRYAQLPTGNYKFIIATQNLKGKWTDPTTLVKFSIKKAVWDEVWFRLLVGLIIGGIIVFIVYRYINKIEEKHEVQKTIMDLERRALQAQMNPHFIFNSLTSIQSLISQNNNEKAEKFLVTFSRLVRTALNHSSESYVFLEEEIELIENYIKLESLRFSNVFDYQIIIKREVSTDSIEVPPMIIQPFVENAIEHGLLKMEKKGMLKIIISIENEEVLRCEIIDNGVGRAVSSKAPRRKGRESKGIQLVKDRLQILNKNSKVEIEDLNKNGVTGTKVIVYLPYKNIDE